MQLRALRAARLRLLRLLLHHGQLRLRHVPLHLRVLQLRLLCYRGGLCF
jgi:hypothetical protein